MVCTISVLAAILSMIINPPSDQYISFIDFRVLGILFSLMCVVLGFEDCGFLDCLCHKLLKTSANLRWVSLILACFCFVTSMCLTNDVALLAIVPLTLVALNQVADKNIIYIVVILTLAANLGSMSTPIGNPQNLYLFSKYNLHIAEFSEVILPFSMISLAVIIILCLFIKPIKIEMHPKTYQSVHMDIKDMGAYSIIFVISVLSVLRIIDYRICAAAVAVFFIIKKRPLLAKVDFGLLLTFTAFFITVGNIRESHLIDSYIGTALSQDTALTSVIVSQFISNVPAAILISQFTENWKDLLIGVNLGGMGTLIASLASLISFKLYCKKDQSRPTRYLKIFFLLNIIVLILLLSIYWLFCR